MSLMKIFQFFPTYASVFPINDLIGLINGSKGVPNFNPMGLLHGEQWCEFHNPLPKDEKVQYQMEFVDLEDKGKGTVLCLKTRIFNEKENKDYGTLHSLFFAKGLKGENYKSNGFIKKKCSSKDP